MKRIFYFTVILFFALPVWAQQIPKLPSTPSAKVIIDPSTKQKVKELCYLLKSDGKTKHGDYFVYSIQDTLLISGTYNKGVKHGLWKFRHRTPPYKLKTKGTYKAGKKVGVWSDYSVAGVLLRELKYAENGKDVIVKEFYSNSRAKSEGNMLIINNKEIRTGKWVLWHKNGTKKAEGMYSTKKSGKKVAVWKYWFPSSQLEREENYNNYGQLDGKTLHYNEAGTVSKIDFYSAGTLTHSEDRFSGQRKSLDSLKQASEAYKSSFPKIYAGEIAQIYTQLEAFKKMPNTENSYQTGEKIVKKLRKLVSLRQELLEQDKAISSSFTKIENTYKTDFPKIYAGEILAEQEKLKNYKNLTEAAKKSFVGKALLKKLKSYNDEFEQLKDNEQVITKKHANIAKNLEAKFPPVFEKVEAKIQTDLNAYKQVTSVSEKRAKGNALIEKLDGIEGKSHELVVKDQELTSKADINVQYKKNFPKVYKNFSPLVDRGIKDYNENTDLESKLKKISSLMGFYERLTVNYAKLKEQEAEIQAKYKEFQEKLKNDGENKYVYKRGKILYEAYLNAYKQQIATNRRISVGNEVLAILDQFISYAGKDNPELIGKLRKAVTPKAMKEAFGIK